jgi:uncharacterized RmlC-like cupin family protein
MVREAAIAESTVGAQKIWLGHVELGPGLISAVHHHGEAESGIYIISGDARFYCGDNLDEAHEAHAGDFVWVPPHVVQRIIGHADPGTTMGIYAHVSDADRRDAARLMNEVLRTV